MFLSYLCWPCLYLSVGVSNVCWDSGIQPENMYLWENDFREIPLNLDGNLDKTTRSMLFLARFLGKYFTKKVLFGAVWLSTTLNNFIWKYVYWQWNTTRNKWIWIRCVRWIIVKLCFTTIFCVCELWCKWSVYIACICSSFLNEYFVKRFWYIYLSYLFKRAKLLFNPFKMN